jgi:hypothetical protein
MRTVYLIAPTGATLASFQLPAADVAALKNRHATSRSTAAGDVYTLPPLSGVERYINLADITMLYIQ